MVDATNNAGFEQVPPRYDTPQGEAIDVIRQRLAAMVDVPRMKHMTIADLMFAGFCAGTQVKYELREGQKAGADNDSEKRDWYAQMLAHVFDPVRHADPRRYRRKGARS